MTDFEEQVGAAGAVVAAVAAGVAVLLAVTPPAPGQLAEADPLVQLVAGMVGVAGIPLVSVAPALAWWLTRRPSPAGWRRAARQAATAIVALGIALPLLRIAVGPAFPRFIPPEESARPGMALGLCAALIEEGVFRLVVLAVPYAAWVRRGGGPLVAGVSCVTVSALILALVHEVGPGAAVGHAPYFMARFVVLGCGMGAAFVWLGPVLLVAGHCAAHVLIPLLFPGASG